VWIWWNRSLCRSRPRSASSVFGVKLHAVREGAGLHDCPGLPRADRFESPKSAPGLSASVRGSLSPLVYLVGQYTAISIVLVWLFGYPALGALLISGVIITAYTVVGGLYAVSWTDPDPGGHPDSSVSF